MVICNDLPSHRRSFAPADRLRPLSRPLRTDRGAMGVPITHNRDKARWRSQSSPLLRSSTESLLAMRARANSPQASTAGGAAALGHCTGDRKGVVEGKGV